MEYIYKTPKLLENETSDLCPGCLQGIAIKIVCEAIEEAQTENVQILSLGAACPEGAQGWGDFTFSKPLYAAGAMSAGIKRLHPDKTILIFQGEGMSGAAMSDTIHTANRGDSVTVISVNNLCAPAQAPLNFMPGYSAGGFGGMQGFGYPPMGTMQNINTPGLKAPETIAALPKPVFVARVSVHDPKEIIKAKNAVKKGLQIQADNLGYSFIEILCPCHINLNIDVCDISEYTQKNILKDYPTGIFKPADETV